MTHHARVLLVLQEEEAGQESREGQEGHVQRDLDWDLHSVL